MKYKTSHQEELIAETAEQAKLDSPPILSTPAGSIEASDFYYRDLLKNAREIMRLSPGSLTSLLKECGMAHRRVECCTFSHFYFSSCAELVGCFKVIYAEDSSFLIDIQDENERQQCRHGSVSVCWNGTRLRAY
jgi:hypothetical protein